MKVEKLETEENQQPTAQDKLDGVHLQKVHGGMDVDRRPPCHFWCRSGLT
jgi:hypothetical protein